MLVPGFILFSRRPQAISRWLSAVATSVPDHEHDHAPDHAPGGVPGGGGFSVGVVGDAVRLGRWEHGVEAHDSLRAHDSVRTHDSLRAHDSVEGRVRRGEASDGTDGEGEHVLARLHTEAQRSHAAAFETGKANAGGLHFLAVQESPSAETLDGFWVMHSPQTLSREH